VTVTDDRHTFESLIEAWKADPTDAEVLDLLEPVVRAQGRWNELLELTRTLVTHERTPARALAYAEAMIRWTTREVPMPDHALHYLERIRDLDATHWLVRLFQASKYAESGDAKRELEELDRAALSAKRVDDRVRIHLMMATRHGSGRMKSAAEAKRHLVAALALDPYSMETLRALEQIHRDEGDLAALTDVLEQQVDAGDQGPSNEAERVAVLLGLAEIYEKQFLQPDKAAEKLEQAFALDPSKDEAIAGLERCYTAMRSWSDLVRVLEGAAALADDAQERAERLVSLAEIFESKLRDLAGAVQAYERLGRLLPDDETLVGELARLTEKMGDWEAAARHRTRLADLAEDAPTRARMHVLAAQLVRPHDRALSRHHFERAVTFDPSNAAAWNTLITDARLAGDLLRVAHYLDERAAATEAPRAQSQIQAELGEVRRALGDEAGALEAWEAAIGADPNNESAARALLDIYVAKRRWNEASALCDLVLYAADRDGDFDRLFVARRQACVIATELFRPERALTMAIGAVRLRADQPEVRQTLVECAWALRADPLVFNAAEALAAIADASAAVTALAPEARAKLGEVLAFTGERDRAVGIFEDVLAEQPDNARALGGLSGLRAARGESLSAWTLKRQLAETLSDDQERYEMLLETADGFETKAMRPDLAVQVYEQARAMRPKDRTMLHKLLTQYQTLEDWPRTVDVLRAIVDADDDGPRKAKIVMAMGHIVQSKLADRMRAALLYDEALDLDPTRLEAFERVVRLLTEVKDWPALRVMYNRMLVRARDSGDVRLQHALQHQVGLVYRDRLGDREGAIAAFRAAVALRPNEEQDQAILRELLATSGQAHDAIAITLERARREPLEPTPYPALFDLLAQGGYTDRAWCVASVMGHLGIAHAPAMALHQAVWPAAIEHIPGSLGVEGWRRLLHPELDPTLTLIFEVMTGAAVDARVAQMGLRERHAHPGPALQQPAFLLHDIERACRLLGVVPPRLFASKAPPAIGIAAARPASLLVHVDSLPGFPRNLLAFWIGKRLAEVTPPLAARGLFRSVSELKELVGAAARVVGLGKRLPSDDALRAHLRKEPFEALGVAVQRALATGASLDVRRWSQLADLSASRAGLVLAGDVETARLALLRESQSPGDLGPREQMRELVGFFLSEEYAQLRGMLGVALA
jgi:tetratricopeptide (TPR) repeat protein